MTRPLRVTESHWNLKRATGASVRCAEDSDFNGIEPLHNTLSIDAPVTTLAVPPTPIYSDR